MYIPEGADGGFNAKEDAVGKLDLEELKREIFETVAWFEIFTYSQSRRTG